MTVDPAELLRSRGLQVTAQRLAVLRAVSARPHVAADLVAEAVRAEIGAISRQAVYDALGVLVEQGILRRSSRPGLPPSTTIGSVTTTTTWPAAAAVVWSMSIAPSATSPA